MEQLACNFDSTFLLIFSENVYAPLIYYSHLGPIIVSLLLGIFVLLNNPRALANRILFSITFFFSVWVYFDLIVWATEKFEYSMYVWSIMVYPELLVYVGCVYLISYFSNQQNDISLIKKLSLAAFFVPLFLLAHTSYNLLGFDATNCDRAAVEGPLWQYMYLVELILIGWVVLTSIHGYRRMQSVIERRQLLLITVGVLIFLLAFTAGNLTIVLELDWSYEQYKLFGMPIFVAFIAYSIVKFKTFHTKLITAQALIAALAIAVLSLLFLQTIPNIRIIAGITFVFVCVLGYVLIRSVKREIEQREHIEKLAQELEATNERQETLIHFIGHEVKGFLSKDAGAFAALSQGDFGQLPETMKPFVENALAESRLGADSVGNILKASNLKKGTVAYTKEPFDLKVLVAVAVEKAKLVAEQKGLTLTFTTADGWYQMTGDKTQINDHVLRNLIDNAINYTPSGTIEVSLKRSGRNIVFAVKDSGVGITEEDKKRLFTEGGHGKDSQKVNVHSTGYGLFIAKSIVLAHGGTVRAESEGQGKGSTFFMELPVTPAGGSQERSLN